MKQRVINFEKDNLILIPAFFVFIMASLLLYRDMNLSSNLDTSELTKIGQTVSVIQLVKRRYSGDMIWNSLDTREKIYQRDTLQTGEGSTLEVKFDDGSVLSLGENSLVVLDVSDERLNVDISQGAITTRAGKGSKAVALKMGEKTIEASGSIDVNLDKEGDLQFSVNEGTAKVEVNGEQVLVEKNQLGTVSEKGFKINSIPFERIFPTQSKVLIPVSSGSLSYSIPFKWNTVSKVKDMEIQISRQSDFNELFISKKVSTSMDANEISVKLEPSNYFWRLVAFDSSDKPFYGPLWRVSIEGLHPLNLISPSNSQAFSVTDSGLNAEFSWQDLKNNSEYHFKLERILPNKKVEVVDQRVTKDTRLTLKGIAEGSYQWLVIAEVPDSLSNVTSEKYKFSVKSLKELPAAKNLLPSDGAKISWLKGKPLTLSWSPVEGAESYNVKIFRATDADGRTMVLDKRQANSLATFVPENLGSYFWQVQAYAENAKPSPPVLGKFSLMNEKSIQIFSPENAIVFRRVKGSEGVQIDLSWRKLSTDKHSLIEISSNKDFKDTAFSMKIESENIFKLSWNKEGRWYWRVRTSDEKGVPLRSSGVNSFELREVLSSVRVQTPLNNQTFKGFNPVQVKFKWQNIHGAKEYEFALRKVLETGKSRNPALSSENLAITKRTKVNAISISEIPFGKYEWVVKAVDEKGELGVPSKVRNFTHLKKVLPPPSEIFLPEIR